MTISMDEIRRGPRRDILRPLLLALVLGAGGCSSSNGGVEVSPDDDPVAEAPLPAGRDVLRLDTAAALGAAAVVDEEIAFAVTARDTARPAPVPVVTLVDAPDGSELVARGDGVHEFRWRPTAADVGDVRIAFEASRPDAPSVRLVTEVGLRVVGLSRFGEAPPLRELAAVHGLHLGFAAPHDLFEREDSASFTAIAAEEYDILTPENSMKMAVLRRGGPDRFDWERSDELVAFAEAHDMRVHGHPLVWSGQVPGWVRRTPSSERPALMREHIETLVSRYRGRIDVWDVVNEAILRDGSPRDSLWYRSMGEDYIAEAFRIAREHDPDVTLIYNDYDIGWLNPKSDAVLERLARERENGTPIDGVGFQLHLETYDDSPSVDSLRENFRRFAELGLDIYITEMDVAVDWRADPDVEAEKQAVIYADVLRVCVEQPRCRALQTWGLGDRGAWRSSLKVMPFDEDYRPKPAFRAMQRVLRETPPTPRAPR